MGAQPVAADRVGSWLLFEAVLHGHRSLTCAPRRGSMASAREPGSPKEIILDLTRIMCVIPYAFRVGLIGRIRHALRASRGLISRPSPMVRATIQTHVGFCFERYWTTTGSRNTCTGVKGLSLQTRHRNLAHFLKVKAGNRTASRCRANPGTGRCKSSFDTPERRWPKRSAVSTQIAWLACKPTAIPKTCASFSRMSTNDRTPALEWTKSASIGASLSNLPVLSLF